MRDVFAYFENSVESFSYDTLKMLSGNLLFSNFVAVQRILSENYVGLMPIM